MHVRIPHLDGIPGVDDLLAPGQTIGGVHGDGADRVVADVLRDLEHEADVVVGHLERAQDRGQLAIEPNVDDGADDLRDDPRSDSAAIKRM